MGQTIHHSIAGDTLVSTVTTSVGSMDSSRHFHLTLDQDEEFHHSAADCSGAHQAAVGVIGRGERDP